MSIAAPVVCWLGLALAVPYAFAHSAAPLLVASPAQRNLLARRVYPALLLAAVLAALAVFQVSTVLRKPRHLPAFHWVS